MYYQSEKIGFLKLIFVIKLYFEYEIFNKK